MKRFAAVVMVFVMLVSASVTAFADSVMSETEVKTDTSSGSGGSSGGSSGGGGSIGGGVGGIGGGGSQTAHTGLPNVNFAVTYQKNSGCFKVEAEVNSEDCGQDAEVMSAVYKNGVFQKLLFSIKLDSDSVYDKKITRYSIVSESDNPEDFCFKCFTLGEDIRPLLPAYTVTGKEAMGGSEKQTVTLRGVVTANSATDIYSAETAVGTADSPFIRVALTENRTEGNADFEIPSVQTFAAGNTDAEDYLGMAVIMDVEKTEDGSCRVVSIGEDTEINNTVTFPLNCFDSFEIEGSGSEYLRYFANATDPASVKATLSKSLSVVYNNVGGQTLDDIFFDGYITSGGRCTYSGDVTLIDNDDCGGYDVVLVNIAMPAVVEFINDSTISFRGIVGLPNGDSLSELDTEWTNRIDIIKNGEKIDCTELSEWDVLSVYAAADDAAYIRAEVITNRIDGKIEGSYTNPSSATGVGFVINENEYNVTRGACMCDALEIGGEGIFYIDKYGRLAAYREKVSRNYAYVYTSKVVNGMDLSVRLNLITENGASVVELAQSVLLYATDGSRVIRVYNINYTGDSQKDLQKFFGTDINGQVINYTLNSEGKIEKIRLAGYNDLFECTYDLGYNEIFDAANNKLGKYIDADSMIFFIDSNDSDKCSVGSVSDLADGETYKVLKMYADLRTADNNIIVIEGDKNKISKATSLAVITSVYMAEDENGYGIYRLSYYTDGVLNEKVETVEAADLDGIYAQEMPTVGDIVKLKVNGEGKICAIKAVWNMRENVRNDTIADTDYVERKAEGDPAGTV